MPLKDTPNLPSISLMFVGDLISTIQFQKNIRKAYYLELVLERKRQKKRVTSETKSCLRAHTYLLSEFVLHNAFTATRIELTEMNWIRSENSFHLVGVRAYVDVGNIAYLRFLEKFFDFYFFLQGV